MSLNVDHRFGTGASTHILTRVFPHNLKSSRTWVWDDVGRSNRGIIFSDTTSDQAGLQSALCPSEKRCRDAGQVFRYLRDPMTGRVIDMTYTDTSDLYNQPPPTWVAVALTECQLS